MARARAENGGGDMATVLPASSLGMTTMDRLRYYSCVRTHPSICTTTDGIQSTSVFFFVCVFGSRCITIIVRSPDHSAGYAVGRPQLDSVNQHDVIMKRLWYKPAQFVPTISSGTASVVVVFGSTPDDNHYCCVFGRHVNMFLCGRRRLLYTFLRRARYRKEMHRPGRHDSSSTFTDDDPLARRRMKKRRTRNCFCCTA
jgi:hypothetical protein